MGGSFSKKVQPEYSKITEDTEKEIKVISESEKTPLNNYIKLNDNNMNFIS